jgi:hypothetical protein
MSALIASRMQREFICPFALIKNRIVINNALGYLEEAFATAQVERGHILLVLGQKVNVVLEESIDHGRVAILGGQMQARVQIIIVMLQILLDLSLFEKVVDYVQVALDTGDVEASLTVAVLGEQILIDELVAVVELVEDDFHNLQVAVLTCQMQHGSLK